MLNGLYSALLVPYDEHGKVKEKGLREVVRYNLDVQKVDGLYVNGSTGENFMLSTEQKKQILAIAKDEAGDAAKLVAQVGSINLDEALELARYATELGYPCLSAVTPFYYRFGFSEIKSYYEAMIDATGNDMLIYAIPALTGVSMSVEQYDELFANAHIIGVKFTNADFFMLERLRKRHPQKIIMYGVDEMLIHGLVAGANGAIGSTYNINGQRAARIMQLVGAGNVAAAYAVQHECNDIISALHDMGIYQSLKEVLRVKGVDAGTCKKPMRDFDPARRGDLEKLVATYGL